MFWYFSVQQMVKEAYTFFSFFVLILCQLNKLQDKLNNTLNCFKLCVSLKQNFQANIFNMFQTFLEVLWPKYSKKNIHYFCNHFSCILREIKLYINMLGLIPDLTKQWGEVKVTKTRLYTKKTLFSWCLIRVIKIL